MYIEVSDLLKIVEEKGLKIPQFSKDIGIPEDRIY